MSNKTCFTTKEANMLIINPIEPKAKIKIGNSYFCVFDSKDIPNAFHRFMQRLILGIEWEIKESKNEHL
jgi:hypothetical protein